MTDRDKAALLSALSWEATCVRTVKGWQDTSEALWGDPVAFRRASRVLTESTCILEEARQRIEDFLAGKIDAGRLLICGQDAHALRSIDAGRVSPEESGIVGVRR